QTFTVGGLTDVAFSADGKAVVTASSDKLVRVHTLAQGWIRKQGGAIAAVTVTPNSTRVIVAGADNNVVVRDANDGKEVRVLQVANPKALAAAVDNAKLLIGS